jgi:hypothetical protein
MKKFDTLLESFLKEEDNEDQDFSYYTGPSNDVLFLDDLDALTLKRKVEEGEQFKTVHVATRKDAVNYGYPDQSGHDFYIFYTKQDFTKPALIPV